VIKRCCKNWKHYSKKKMENGKRKEPYCKFFFGKDTARRGQRWRRGWSAMCW